MAHRIELAPIPNKSHATSHVTSKQASRDRDALELAKVGKKQVLERRFGLTSMIGFSCSLMVTWEGAMVYVLKPDTTPQPLTIDRNSIFGLTK